jgi:hypothetical protein
MDNGKIVGRLAVPTNVLLSILPVDHLVYNFPDTGCFCTLMAHMLIDSGNSLSVRMPIRRN